MHAIFTIKLKRNTLFPPQIPLFSLNDVLLLRIFNLKIPSMAAFHNIETIFLQSVPTAFCPTFPSLFPQYKNTTSNSSYLQKEIQFCFTFLLKHGQISLKFVLPRFTTFSFFSPRVLTGSFSPCGGIFPWMWVASLACNKYFEKCPRCTLDILGTCSSLCLPSRDLKIPTSLFVNL